MHTELTIDNLKRINERPSRERLVTQMSSVMSGQPLPTDDSPSTESQDVIVQSPATETVSAGEVSDKTTVTTETVQAVQAPKRKSGIVTGFRTAEREYLELVMKDLELPIDTPQMFVLQEFFQRYGREPSVAELYFLASAQSTYLKGGAAPIAVGEVLSDDAYFYELFRDMIRRYIYESGNDTKSPLFTALAEFAATGKAFPTDCGISICHKSAPIFPDIYDGGEDVIDIGDYYLTLSSGKKLGGDDAYGFGVLLYPRGGDDTSEFFRKAFCVCREYIKNHPSRKIIKCTKKGLVRDLMDNLRGALIETRLLPGAPTVADVVWDSYAPAVIIVTPRDELGELYSIATQKGVSVASPIALQADVITVNAAEGSVTLSKNSLSKFDVPVICDSSPRPKVFGRSCGNITVATQKLESSFLNTTITVSTIEGEYLYEKLVSVFQGKGKSAFAVTGTLDVTDSELFNYVVTLDSMRRNLSPNIIYSRFFNGEKTELTIIELSQK